MAGTGDLELCGPYKKFEVPIDVWAGMSKERRDKHYKRFMKQPWYLDQRTFISSDGAHAFIGPGQSGEKRRTKGSEEKM